MPTPIITEEQERAMSASLHDDLNKLGQTMLRIRDERDLAVAALKNITNVGSGPANHSIMVAAMWRIAADALSKLGSL